jgi:hypothetical protein
VPTIIKMTERHSRVVNTPILHSGGSYFKLRLETGYPATIFMALLSPSRHMSEQWLISLRGQDKFSPHPFEFIF